MTLTETQNGTCHLSDMKFRQLGEESWRLVTFRFLRPTPGRTSSAIDVGATALGRLTASTRRTFGEPSLPRGEKKNDDVVHHLHDVLWIVALWRSGREDVGPKVVARVS
ncbi:hypothetical protein MTO96_008466 [Rhipicephalus appendiculatus]